MENASKALIIAGAILLAILLISMGMLVLNKATGILDNDQLDEAAVTTFNQRFTKYAGDKVKGSNVRSLMSEVAAYNGSDDRESSDGEMIKFATGSILTVDDTTGAPKVVSGNTITNTKNYKVEITQYTKGKVSEIKVTEATTNP